MKKRIVEIVVPGMIAMLLFAACGNTAQNTEPPAAGKQEQTESADRSVPEVNSPAEQQTEPVSDGASESEPIDEQAKAKDFIPLEPFKKDAAIEETVLFEEQDLKITAKSLTYGNYSADLELLFENNSDKPLTFIAQSLGYSCNAVNDTMLPEGYVNVDVAAGDSATEIMDFNYDNMILYGISEIGTIQTGFSICDEEYNYIYTGPIEVKTSAADTVDSSAERFRETMKSRALQYTYDLTLDYYSEEEVYASAGVSIVTEVVITNKNGKQILMLEEKNETDDTANIYLKDIRINGEMAYEGKWSLQSLTAGKRTVEDIALDRVLDEEERAESGIEEIESIGFTVEVRNDDGMVMAEPSEITIRIR